jgi:hypothetical protein
MNDKDTALLVVAGWACFAMLIAAINIVCAIGKAIASAFS